MSSHELSASPPIWIRVLVGRHPRRTLIRILVLVAASFFVFRFILLPIRIFGISMLPTYRDNRFNLVNRWAYWRSPPQRGDIVSIQAFSGPSVMLLKRIVGLPGERVAFRQGIIYINGEPLDEPYVKNKRAPWNRKEVTLKADEYFIVGDNREMPDITMHELGEVRRSRIVGKVLF
jgi:signal peptidase I